MPKSRKKVSINKGYFGAPRKIQKVSKRPQLRSLPQKRQEPKVAPPWYATAASPEETMNVVEKKFAAWAAKLIAVTRKINIPVFDPQVLQNDKEKMLLRWENRERAAEVVITKKGIYATLLHWFVESREEYGATYVVDDEDQKTWFSTGDVTSDEKIELLWRWITYNDKESLEQKEDLLSINVGGQTIPLNIKDLF